ncbi:DUF4159 domain-containing protein [Tuwongella immobilis]|uniref:DUF4159 domain-containing protein n=1 Tax=Tuwongella immobilis TaxID=692036 RepID=A0A6C2YTD9_9BACT|nr:DUF4159 domain-containing protein [Tuwongella immobilis]VIP04152.1 Uncharacterized protein OS=Singulisphaera acidiphila (strain ATCC BAA-1392 / DSM 18658 / VKM B-2454 / MOB10) GN=Sinac_7312 PE=4 SV=1: DUF4159: DUF4159 [Tuwongella immobilis]VTS05669.1 Uncharacterized protein OS=Singulisphaera acidiphila (strain ATCC BAA-1392 / DSM 18658 / VKM B-2454 / MOB10) GN=Sinac_7312 PE=4 SV=1: DUF4159: DUF4159 [Tuwongella immobilis]
MMPVRRWGIILGVVLITVARPMSLIAAEEPLVEQVRRSIDRGIQYLRQTEAGRGNWEIGTGALLQRGGWTCLAMLGLLNAGVKPDDPVIQRGLDYVRALPAQATYVTGLQTMVLAEAGFPRDLPLIQRNVNWLIGARVYRGGQFVGWSYTSQGGGGDGSNSQYALLGLAAGRAAGAKIDEDVWREIRDFYIKAQVQEDDGTGGWRYLLEQRVTTLTMTEAGICGLFISGLELHAGQQKLDEITGVAARCNVYEENAAIAKGLRWMADDNRFGFKVRGHTFYNIYGIERVGRLSGRRFIGEHDWYREGCQLLVDMQLDDGSWSIPNAGTDSWSVVSTSFSLLFLSKGRTPILISKFAHGPDDEANVRGGGWNNKQHDARHLVEYASKELFKKQPLAWQIYDCRKLDLSDEATIREEVTGLLQSPILFMNGHQAPRITDGQKKVLKRYIEEGGFLVAEACCGREEFARGFRQLMSEIFPNNPLRPVPADHPLWRAHRPVPPGLFPKLEAIELGCKTVVVFSPEPIAGYWEEKRFAPRLDQPATNRGEHAYRLAGNIIAYATGLELPKPRLTRVEIADNDARQVPRSYLKVAQIRHEGNWEPAPQAMRNLMFHVREQAKLDVALQKEVLPITHPDLYQYKLMYMHGRNRFVVDEVELESIRANLETGGLLFADACCGKKEFDEAFRDFAAKLFPKQKLQRIPLDDYLFSDKLNGSPLKAVMCRREKADGSAEAEFQNVAPFLEGIQIDGRWVLIYSKYDIGCALEKHQSSDCKGHNHESALRIGQAIVLYALKR